VWCGSWMVRSCAGFSDAGIDKASRALGPASEKRQGTKSRELEHRCGELYGDLGTGKGIVIARGRDRRGWRGMPSELIATDEWREREGCGARLGLPGPWKVVIEREPPLRAGNQRQRWTERLAISGANGIITAS
jgi:hypothetical protein